MTRCMDCGSMKDLQLTPDLVGGEYCNKDAKSGAWYRPKDSACCLRRRCILCWQNHFHDHSVKGIKYVKCVADHAHGEPVMHDQDPNPLEGEMPHDTAVS